MFFYSHCLDEFLKLGEKNTMKILICLESVESNIKFLRTYWRIEYLVTLVLSSDTSDEIMASCARKYIPGISTFWNIERIMHVVAFPQMARERTVFRESTICSIENIRRTKKVVCVEAFLIIVSIGYEVTVF
jgi:hypothetical protein